MKVRVVAGVIYFEQKILLARRSPGQKLAGYWEFPGGKMEENENAFDALVREIQEEFLLYITPVKTLLTYDYSYDFGDLELIGIEAVAPTQNITLHVHDKAEWVSIPALSGYKLAPADIALAEFLIKYNG